MIARQHSHPKYIQLFKNSFAALAFLYPVYMLLTLIPGIAPNSGLKGISVVVVAFFSMIFILVAAYFFQDVSADEEGLQIEFLWRKYEVRWEDMIEAKTALGFWLAPEKNRPLIILVGSLTPFHRVFGILYGLSIRPAFVIYPSISDFQGLKDNIRKHLNARRKTK